MKKEQIKEQVIAIVISIIIIVIGAIFSIKYANYITLKDSILIGLFSYIVVIVVFLGNRFYLIDKIKQIDNNITDIKENSEYVNKLKKIGTDSFDSFWALCLLRAANGTYKQIDSDSFEINKEQIPQFWLQAAINTDVNWYCTNYVNSNEDYNSGWVNYEFGIQSQCMKQNGTIVQRLFIIKDEDEKSKINEQVNYHKRLGFVVKTINKTTGSNRWAPFDELEKLIGTIDIAIINGKYLFAFILTENKNDRSLLKIQCYSNSIIVKKSVDIYNRLWESAENSIKKTTLPNKRYKKLPGQ
jgi:ABC-type multidrug transport system fused ATPase/permease subunit